jgi:hypothetical protein
MYRNIIIFIVLIQNILSLQKLWIIRHCDKPDDHKNPCCSEKGQVQSRMWGNFFTNYFDKNDKINIVASNYRSNNLCKDNITESFYFNKIYNSGNFKQRKINQYDYYNDYYNDDKYVCQKSQRMFLTSQYLSNTLIMLNYSVPQINIDYCVGQVDELYTYVNMLDQNVILVWEHDDIIKIIRKFGIKIDNWKKKLRDSYNIVFMVDIKNIKLYYSCYNFMELEAPGERGIINKCSKNIENWLYKFENIDSMLSQLASIKKNNYYKNIFNENIHIFIICFVIFVLSLFLYILLCCNKKNIKSRYVINFRPFIRKQEYKYVEIT